MFELWPDQVFKSHYLGGESYLHTDGPVLFRWAEEVIYISILLVNFPFKTRVCQFLWWESQGKQCSGRSTERVYWKRTLVNFVMKYLPYRTKISLYSHKMQQNNGVTVYNCSCSFLLGTWGENVPLKFQSFRTAWALLVLISPVLMKKGCF